jgi:cellulose biosynthesis protein BcsQ
MKKTLFIAFSTQKGGVGKTTFTTLAASWLHYRLGFNVAVMDCDFPQWSIHSMRKREAEQLQKNDFYQKKAMSMFESLGKGTYPIICTQPDNGVLDRANEFLASQQTDYDVILFDLPGTINNEGVVNTILGLDYLFVPISASHLIMTSTLPFITGVNGLKAGHPDEINLKRIYLFWNMVVSGSRRELYEHYENIIDGANIPLLKTAIPRSLRYDREQSIKGNESVFLSTVFPPDKTLLKDSNFEPLMDEIIEIINLKK